MPNFDLENEGQYQEENSNSRAVSYKTTTKGKSAETL